ncbi:MAG: hypothetical protein IKH54_00850 [Bacilli bacterium]|nr:hypothetical protein [Bacilli bacterium]
MFDEVFEKNEDDLLNNIACDNACYFSDEIISRGEKYYDEGRVSKVTKLGNVFVASVSGSDDYTVRVVANDSETLMSCDCPYEDNCKHEYATLLAIENNDYEEKELRPYVPAKRLSEEDLIKKIPAEALKKYILSDRGLANTDFDMDDLEKTFIEYVPKQEYDYYYNNLYNSYLLKDEFFELYDSYYDEIRLFIDSTDYLQAFNVIKAIIEVSHDLDIDIVPDLPELGMYLRIAYRKASKEIKKEIEKYVMSLIFHQYYNNCYLEDMIVHMN